MSFSFDGQYRSRPNINLSGSSRLRDRDNLIREAFLERKKREEEKRQQQAALKIQSVYRSYAVRKQVKNQLRIAFKDLFSNNAQLTENIPKLFSYFVTFFDEKQDQEELIRFSRFIMENKDLINQHFSHVMFSLVKFLSFHLNNLKKPQTNVSHSVSLRLIDFFTDYQFQNRQKVLVLLIIKHHYLSQLVKYAIEKIPNSVTNENQAPLLSPISNLIYRAICCLTLQNQHALNEKIVNKVLTELFVYSNYNQIKCVINMIAAITADKHQFESILCLLKAFESQYGSNKENQTANNLTYLDYLLILKCILRIVIPSIDYLDKDQYITFINVLELTILKILQLDMNFETKSIEDDDDQVVQIDSSSALLEEIFQILDKKFFTNRTETLFQSLVHSNQIVDSPSLYYSFSYLCYFMLKLTRFKIHESSMLRKIAFNKEFLRRLWKQIGSMQLEESNNFMNCLRILISGNLSKLNLNDLYKIVAPLTTFCSLYNLFLLPILDVEFLEGQAIFTKSELIEISSILKDVCIGIIQLMHPETTSPAQTNTYFTSRQQQTAHASSQLDLKLKKQASCFTLLFQACSLLVQRLYIRDIRAGFCNEDHWLSSHMRLVSLSRLSEILHTYEPSILTDIKFGHASCLFQNENENIHHLNVNDIRSLTILQELPFTVPFRDRLEILEGFIHQEPRHVFNEPTCRLRIRRDFLYEDAFDNLSLENVENLKSTRLVVEMINQLGLEEAGIDGGGVFREFMLKLLETSFDPNRGLFVLTSDGFLYPNPNIGFLIEDYEKHYFFLGRICAKAIQAKILTPLKFAMFFLQKILSKYSDTRLDIDYLASLDPEVNRNLLSLKDIRSNIQDLELNFALNLNEFGETKLIELKPGGKDIYVTNDNKIEYIHLVADYKLNRQIHNQVIAFRNGMSNVINLELLRLFNFNELQFLISGSDELIDVADWQANTLYSGVYSPNNEVIKTFWNVVESFTEEQKRLLLKFVTSRSRTPLFGFKNLIPNFAIHPSASERLPTASTCLNLLKLPPIEDFDLLKERLLCAISSDVGFELS